MEHSAINNSTQLCVPQKKVWTTWRWTNDDRVFILIWTIPLSMFGRCDRGTLLSLLSLLSLILTLCCVLYLFVCHALFLQLLSNSWASVFLPPGSMHPAEGAALSRWQNASQWNYVDLSSVTDGAQTETMNTFSGKVVSKADVWSLVCFPFNLSFFKTSSQMLFVNSE